MTLAPDLKRLECASTSIARRRVHFLALVCAAVYAGVMFALVELISKDGLKSSHLLRHERSIPRARPSSYNGTVYIFFNETSSSGGPATLHHLHSTLVAGGFRSAMYIANVAAYGEDFPNLVPLRTWPPHLQPGDVVLLPEFYAGVHPHVVELLTNAARISGARLVMFILGIHFPLDVFQRTCSERVTYIPVTRRIAQGLGLVTSSLMRPLQPKLYTHVRSWMQTGGDVADKQAMVVVDGDTQLSEAALKDIASIQGADGMSTRIVFAEGYEQAQLWALMQNASVWVDSNIPGHERGALECTLYGVIPVLPADPVPGSLHDELPTLVEARATFSNDTSVVLAVKFALSTARNESVWGLNNPGARLARSLVPAWPGAVRTWFGSLGYLIVVSVQGGEEDMAARQALVLARLLPLCRIALILDDPVNFYASKAVPALRAAHLWRTVVIAQNGTEHWADAQTGTVDDVPMAGGSVVISLPVSVLPLSADLFSVLVNYVLPGAPAAPKTAVVLMIPPGCDRAYSIKTGIDRIDTAMHDAVRAWRRRVGLRAPVLEHVEHAGPGGAVWFASNQWNTTSTCLPNLTAAADALGLLDSLAHDSLAVWTMR